MDEFGGSSGVRAPDKRRDRDEPMLNSLNEIHAAAEERAAAASQQTGPGSLLSAARPPSSLAPALEALFKLRSFAPTKTMVVRTAPP